jgi:hypothetical protein
MNAGESIIGLVTAVNKGHQPGQNIRADKLWPGNMGLEDKIKPIRYQQAKVYRDQGPIVDFLILKAKIDQGSDYEEVPN